jgi:hypothetical protein
MKTAKNDKASSRHIQLPLRFSKADPGAFIRMQHDTLLQINRMIETISDLLENAHARDDIRNTALVELQKIKKAIELDKPGSPISKQRKIAEEALEKTQDIVFSQS